MKRIAAFCLAAPLTLGCREGSPLETVPEGSIYQSTLVRRYSTLPKLDLFVVLRTSATADGAALRANVAAALRNWMRELARGDGPLQDLWNPMDVRAYVVSAAGGSVRSPADAPALAWREEDATDEAARTFADALDAELRDAPAGEGAPLGLLDALGRVLAAGDTPPDGQRVVILVSSSDDPGAPAAKDPRLRGRDWVTLALPDAPAEAGSCERPAAGSLTRWASVNGAVVRTPCKGLFFQGMVACSGRECWPQPIALTADGHPACRVRALVPRGTACDPTRGWRPSTEPVVSSPSLLDSDVCDVVELEGMDADACRDPAAPYSRASSGWCLPGPVPGCSSPIPHAVGGAAPPWAKLEITCNFSR